MTGAEHRWVEVPAERLAGWLERFAAGHGELSWHTDAAVVSVQAADGTVARCAVPFPPLAAASGDARSRLLAHVLTERRVGVVLVRKGGYAAGVFQGVTLVASKVGSRHVQGRAAAGGSSQQRFARRRENQARSAYAAAADTVARVLLPEIDRLAAVVLGGDRRALDATLSDPRLTAVRALSCGPVLPVPDPRQRVLLATPDRFRAVRIQLNDG